MYENHLEEENVQVVLTLCEFHYCEFHHCGYCVHKIKTLLMQILANANFSKSKVASDKDPLYVNCKKMVSRL